MFFFTVPVKNIFLTLSIIAIGSTAFAQQFYKTELSAPVVAPDSSTRDLEAEKKSWTEIPEQRTLKSSAWHTPSGSIMTQFCSRPINYYKNGQLQPINTNLAADENGWSANDQPYPVRVNREGSYELTAINGKSMLFGAGTIINNDVANYDVVFSSEKSILFKDVMPGIDRQIDVRENGAKCSYVIPQRINFAGVNFTITDEIWLPYGCWIAIDSSNGEWKNNLWYGDIIITDANGQENARLHRPLCFDAAGNIIAGGYKLERETWDTGKSPWFVTVSFSGNWLTDASRAYPIVIDPLVTGPTALYTGGVMPSCLIPQYEVDSILVTIPGQITVTACYITCNYYADPFSTAIMADGEMYFSTSCNQTQGFTVAPPNGNLPGTAYLNAFDLRVPLLCCHPQNCSQIQFWLRMHLGRFVGGTGCNTNYIYYDPNSQWPFSCYVEGHTVEFYGQGWSVPNTPICTDQCTIVGTAQIRYGVPPYIIQHQWMAVPDTVSVAAGCSFGNVSVPLTLTIPNCPTVCDTTSTLVVPVPYIVDQCGNQVFGLPIETVPLKPVPVITAPPPQQTVCSGEPFAVALSSCVSPTTITWSNTDTTGTGNISSVYMNSGSTDSTVNFLASGVANGCYSDTITVDVTIDPPPNAQFTLSPSPGVGGVPITLVDQSTTGAGTISSWMYAISTGDTVWGQNPTYVFPGPGFYGVCLTVATANGCVDTTCRTIEIIPAEINAPNVITPNGDGINDVLVFEYLDYYPTNELSIYDRWGKLLYRQSGYQNNWDGSPYTDGTYYYVLTVEGRETLSGFFQLLK